MSLPPAQTRPYAGDSPEQRRARRAEQLLDAGLELFGTRGYAVTSIRDVCAQAGLNRRYFYETFTTREDLFRAVYDKLVASLSAHVLSALEPHGDLTGKIAAGLDAFWAHVTSDPRQARILTVEIVGVSEALERHRREVRHDFARLIAEQALALARARKWTLLLDPTITSRALVAATIDLVVDWMRGDTDMSPAQLAQETMAFYAACARSVFVTADGGPPPELHPGRLSGRLDM